MVCTFPHESSTKKVLSTEKVNFLFTNKNITGKRATASGANLKPTQLRGTSYEINSLLATYGAQQINTMSLFDMVPTTRRAALLVCILTNYF